MVPDLLFRFLLTRPGRTITRLFIDEAHEIVVSQEARVNTWNRLKESTQGLPFQRIFLTATLPPHLEKAFIDNTGFNGNNLRFIRASTNRDEVAYYAIGLDETHPINAWSFIIRLAGHLEARFLSEGTISLILVFFELTEEVDKFAREFRCAKYHSRMSEGERLQNIGLWETGSHLVMAATTGLGQGIHRDNVRHVLIYQNTYGSITYSQITGRAGRDGSFAYATLIYDKNLVVCTRPRTKLCKADPDSVHIFTGMIRDCGSCRRFKLGKIMDGRDLAVKCKSRPDCNPCDFCKPDAPMLTQIRTWIDTPFVAAFPIAAPRASSSIQANAPIVPVSVHLGLT